MLTSDEAEKRLVAAVEREKKARARVAKLKRGLVGVSRRQEAQRLCTLGRAVSVWAAGNERVMAAFRSHLTTYISRDTDREALAGSPFEVQPMPSPDLSRG